MIYFAKVLYTDLRDRNLISLKKETSLTMQHYCQMSICSNIQSKRQNFISGDGKKWLTKNEKCVIHDLKKADKNVFFDSQNVVKNTQTLLVTEVSQSHSGRK